MGLAVSCSFASSETDLAVGLRVEGLEGSYENESIIRLMCITKM